MNLNSRHVPLWSAADLRAFAVRSNNNGSALLTFEQVEAQLMQLQARSKGVMKVDIAGTTIEGRPLYIAKLGTGPQRMWLQGRIHHQGTYLIEDTNIMTTFSIGIPVASWRLDP